jgi:competence protein ComEC
VIAFCFLPPLSPVILIACAFTLFLFSCLAFFILQTYRYHWLFGLAVFLFFFLLGAIMVQVRHEKPIDSVGNQQEFIGWVSENPVQKENTIRAMMRATALSPDSIMNKENIALLCYLQKSACTDSLVYGDVIYFRGAIKPIKDLGNPEEFSFKDFMARQGVYHQVYLDTASYLAIGQGEGAFLRRFSYQTRDKLMALLQEKGLSGDSFEIASALLLGQKQGLGPGIKKSFSAAGAMHILAVSGLHVGIISCVFMFLTGFLRRFKRGKYVQVALVVMVIWFYAFMAGLSPSIQRAAWMFSLLNLGLLMGRQNNVYNILAVSAFILLLNKPLLLFDIGFQFSYLAVIGIVGFYTPVKAMYKPRNKILDFFWSVMAVSISAQLLVSPLSIFYFNQFSNYFLLTNLLVIPLLPIILYLGIAVFAFSFVPLLSNFLGLVLSRLISFIYYCIQWIESLPFSLSDNLYLPGFLLLPCYILVLSFLAYMVKKQAVAFQRVLVLSVVTVLGFWFHGSLNQQKKELVIFNTPSCSAFSFKNGNTLWMYKDAQHADDSSILEWATANYLLKNRDSNIQYLKPGTANLSKASPLLGTVGGNNLFFSFDTLSVLLLKDDKILSYEPTARLPVDFLVYAGGAKIPVSQLNSYFQARQIILGSSIPFYELEPLKEKCREENIPFHCLPDDGAFQLVLN